MRRTALLIGSLVSLAIAGCATQGAGTPASSTNPAPIAAAPVRTAPGPAAAAHAAGSTRFVIPEPTAAEVAAGIQIAHVGVTASGGLVDARFRVLDPAKANLLLGNAANAPHLVAGDKPPLMPPHHSVQGGRLAKNQLIMILYPNTRQAVQPGTEVSVAFGSVQIGPVKAE